MTRLKRIAALAVALGILASGIILLTTHESPEVVYRGDAILNTTQEYAEFKTYIADPRITVWDIDALSSEPPIWVQYRMVVPRDLDFPYPYSSKGVRQGGMFFWLCVVVGVGGALTIASVLWLLDREKQK